MGWQTFAIRFFSCTVHTPGRTLGMAGYLSRHPSKYEGVAIQAEKLINHWFTVNVVGDITPKFKGLASSRGPIKLRESYISERKNVNRVLTVHAPTQANKDSELVVKSTERKTMASNNELSTSKICHIYIHTNAEKIWTIQNIINLVRNRNTAIIARPPSWREKFNSLSIGEIGEHYMDNRLVIPKDMRENVFRAIPFRNAWRDALPREASDIWWPRVYREIVEKAKNCSRCQQAGKNLKCVKSQNEIGKIPESNKPNEEIALEFARPFQNANQNKNFY